MAGNAESLKSLLRMQPTIAWVEQEAFDELFLKAFG
jgi:hypothetical protein